MSKGLLSIAHEEQEIRARLKTRTVAITNARLALERQEQEQAEDLAKLDALARDAVEAFAQTRAIAVSQNDAGIPPPDSPVIADVTVPLSAWPGNGAVVFGGFESAPIADEPNGRAQF